MTDLISKLKRELIQIPYLITSEDWEKEVEKIFPKFHEEMKRRITNQRCTTKCAHNEDHTKNLLKFICGEPKTCEKCGQEVKEC